MVSSTAECCHVARPKRQEALGPFDWSKQPVALLDDLDVRVDLLIQTNNYVLFGTRWRIFCDVLDAKFHLRFLDLSCECTGNGLVAGGVRL